MRKSWDEYFLDLADLVATRATCLRAHHGCVLVQGRSIISTGYNGSVDREDHCEDVGCLMEAGHCIRTIHSEENAIIQAAVNGVSTMGATAYVTAAPCSRCLARLTRAGVWEIIYRNKYLDGETQSIPTETLVRSPNSWLRIYANGYEEVSAETERTTGDLLEATCSDAASVRVERKEESQSCL